MAEPFRWPPEGVEVEAFDFERNAIVSLTLATPPTVSREPIREAPPSVVLPAFREPPFAARDAALREAQVAVREPSRESRSSSIVEDTRASCADDTGTIDHVAAATPSRSIRWLSRLIPKAAVALLAALVVMECAWVYRSITAIVPIWEQKLLPPAASAATAKPADENSPAADASKPKTPVKTPAGLARRARATVPSPQVAVAVPGSISIPLPIQVQVFEHGRFVGTNDAQISLAPGSHDLEIENQSLHYRASMSVDVGSGQSVAIHVPLPAGVVSVTAAPPAEVFIDGLRQGETPLTDIPVPIGPHQIVFRHALLGEHRRSVVVNLASPLRLRVDFRQ